METFPVSLTPAQALQVAVVFGLVSALRKSWPAVDGRLVWLLIVALSLAVAFVGKGAATWQQAAFSGLVTAVGALSLDGALSRVAEHVAASKAPPGPPAA